MKINNKGMTLVELIVSFMIVSVASLYFFQTIVTVNKIYQSSLKEIDKNVNKTCITKLIYENIKKNGVSGEDTETLDTTPCGRESTIYRATIHRINGTKKLYVINYKESRSSKVNILWYQVIDETMTAEE